MVVDKHYSDANNISMKNIASYTADGATVMIGKKKECLKLMTDDNQKILLLH